jgi:ribosomal protein RSM22 (predicted rRNA methylase)
MSMPPFLINAIDQLAAKYAPGELAHAAREISDRYRSQAHTPGQTFLKNEADRLAYLTVRMPATYGAVMAVLQELAERFEGFLPHSMGDLGAGPGTGMWAAVETFPGLNSVYLLEGDRAFLQVGQALAALAVLPTTVQAQWHQGDVGQIAQGPSFDLTLMSYVLGELSSDKRAAILPKAWAHTDQALVIIEPGTKRGYATILEAREQLLALGAHLLAPCPHERACPMVGTEDWCHFAARVSRTSLHRQIKGASLGYEDEKYSYVIFTKSPKSKVSDRIVRHPQKKSGHVLLETCSVDGLKKITISKKQGDEYRWARKVEWGEGR